jgi:ribosomal protein S18 acetylase RimI-like enzyme
MAALQDPELEQFDAEAAEEPGLLRRTESLSLESKKSLIRVDSVSTNCSELSRASSASSAYSEATAGPSVLGEGLATRGVSWTPAFAAQALLRSVYVAASQQAVRPTKEQIARGVVIPHLFECPKNRTDPVIKALLEQALPLSKEHFHEDALSNVNNKSGQRFMLYCSEDMKDLWGFAVYKLKSQSGILALGKLAVPEYLRGLGFGSMLIKELLKVGKSVPALDTLALSSLPGAIAFYQRLGFKKHAGALRADDDDTVYIEGQVYMDKQFRKKPAGGGKASKGKRR